MFHLEHLIGLSKSTDDHHLLVRETSNGVIIAKHRIFSGKGELIQASNHKRDRTKGIDAYIETVASSFSNESKAKVYLEKIREARPRYIRDQLQLITKQIKQCGKEIIDLALEECLNRQLFSATEFSDVVQYLNRQRDDTAVKNLVDYGGIKSIHPWNDSVVQTEVHKRDVSEYLSVLEGDLQ